VILPMFKAVNSNEHDGEEWPEQERSVSLKYLSIAKRLRLNEVAGWQATSNGTSELTLKAVAESYDTTRLESKHFHRERSLLRWCEATVALQEFMYNPNATLAVFQQ